MNTSGKNKPAVVYAPVGEEAHSKMKHSCQSTDEVFSVILNFLCLFTPGNSNEQNVKFW